MLLDLDETEAARVAEGACACGCGEALPADPSSYVHDGLPHPDRRVASSACRKRLHRQRRAAGRSVSLDERARRRRIEDLETRLTTAEREHKRYAAAARQYLDEAARLKKALEAARTLPLL